MTYRRTLNKKELSDVKFETTEEWLEAGNKITVLPEYKPEVKVYFGRNKKSYSPKRGVMK